MEQQSGHIPITESWLLTVTGIRTASIWVQIRSTRSKSMDLTVLLLLTMCELDTMKWFGSILCGELRQMTCYVTAHMRPIVWAINQVIRVYGACTLATIMFGRIIGWMLLRNVTKFEKRKLRRRIRFTLARVFHPTIVLAQYTILRILSSPSAINLRRDRPMLFIAMMALCSTFDKRLHMQRFPCIVLSCLTSALLSAGLALPVRVLVITISAVIPTFGITRPPASPDSEEERMAQENFGSQHGHVDTFRNMNAQAASQHLHVDTTGNTNAQAAGPGINLTQELSQMCNAGALEELRRGDRTSRPPVPNPDTASSAGCDISLIFDECFGKDDGAQADTPAADDAPADTPAAENPRSPNQFEIDGVGELLLQTDLLNKDRYNGRKEFPGAATNVADFQKYFKSMHERNVELARTPKIPPNTSKRMLMSTRRVETDVKKLHPEWPEPIQKLATAALVIFRLRLSDISVREHVQLIWIILGGRYLRSHDGSLYFYDDDIRCWQVYGGMLPERIHEECRRFMQILEGLYRSFDGVVPRTAQGIVDAISVSYSKHDDAKSAMDLWLDNAIFCLGDSKLRVKLASGTGVQKKKDAEDQNESEVETGETMLPDQAPAPADAQAGDLDLPAPPNLWYILMGQACKRVGPAMEKELSEAKVFKYINEWCGTHDQRIRGVVYRDRAVKYDTEHGPTHIVENVNETDNFYVYLPSSLLQTTKEDDLTDDEGTQIRLDDPYLLRAQARVEQFIQSTFWCNIAGFIACQAALALAKRGLNVLPAFIMIGAGGVGLSLFTDLIAASLGEKNHKFFDPYIFFDDEVLRSCIELLVGGCVFSGQERPQGLNKKIRLHLWKKFCTGEGIRGRLPFQILSRMVRLKGWVRLEVNSLMDFESVGELEFESILRRSCVIKIFARFFDAQYLAKHLANSEEYGIFPRDPALPELVTTGPFKAAFNRIQHSFEQEHTEEQCRDVITHFTRNGGDNGMTETYLRMCCRLTRTKQDGGAEVGGIPVETDVAMVLTMNEESPNDRWKEFSLDLMRWICDEGNESMTQVKYNTRGRKDKGLVGSRKELWDKLSQLGLWTSAGHSQKGTVQLRPVIKTVRRYDEIVRQLPAEPLSLPELCNMTKLNAEKHKYLIRHENNELMIQAGVKHLKDLGFNRELSTSRILKPARGKSPLKKQKMDEVNEKLQPYAVNVTKTIDALLRAAEAISSYLDGYARYQATIASPKRRRACRQKSEDTHEIHVPYTVSYTRSRPWMSREYAKGKCVAQRMSQYMQRCIFSNTIDLDIVNCMTTLTVQLIDKLGLEQEVLTAFGPELKLLRRIHTDRASVCKDLHAPLQSGKQLIFKLINSARVHSYYQDNPTAIRLVKLGRFLRWLAYSVLPEDRRRTIEDDVEVDWKGASMFAHFWHCLLYTSPSPRDGLLSRMPSSA